MSRGQERTRALAILKHFKQPQADSYVLPMARDLIVEPPPPPPPEPEKEPDALTADGGGEDGAEAEQAPPTKEEDPLAFARAEADAILRDAEREAEEYRQQAMAALEKELDEERAVAHGEGFSKGYAEGMAEAMDKASKERMRLASQQVEQILQHWHLLAEFLRHGVPTGFVCVIHLVTESRRVYVKGHGHRVRLAHFL